MLGNLGKYLDKLKPQYDDDSVDRLNCIYTIMLLLAFAITIGAKQYVGEPLQCWVPHQFKGGWEQYVENYCFVENTYWVPMYEDIPTLESGEREKKELQYYQWVPFVLALQALMFYIPKIIWNMLNWQTGFNITALMQTAMLTKKDGDRRVLKGDDVEAKPIVQHFRTALKFQKEGKEGGNRFTRTIGKSWGFYVTLLYLLTKLLYIINVVAQLFILNAFLGPQYAFWGFGILRDILQGRPWEESGQFPRVTLCDVQVRQLGNLHRWSVQCVLMINMFNEKIYLFLWWWFLLVAVLTICNFIYWLVISLFPSCSYAFIGRYLRYKGILLGSDDALHKFVNVNICRDGVTILRLISDNCGDLVTAEIVSNLWQVSKDHIVPKQLQSPSGEKSRLMNISEPDEFNETTSYS